MVSLSTKECLGKNGRLSVILPAYNLGSCIYDNILAVAKELNDIPFELVPVDDGSTDNTALEIERAMSALPDGVVVPVVLKKNKGKGAALTAGLRASSGSHIMLLDGDLDLNPNHVWGFFDVMKEANADVVIGSKLHKKSNIKYPFRRRVASFVYYSLVRLLVKLPVHDTQTGAKLFKREALQYAFDRMLAKRFAFDFEVLTILYNKGYKIAEAPVEFDFGEKMGCLTASNVKNVMLDTLGVFYRQRLLHYYDSVEVCPMPKPVPGVSIIIACPNHASCLDECIEKISLQDWGRELEVIILPNEAFPMPKEYPEFVRIVPTGKIRPAEKRNIGIKEAKYELLAFVDDDAAPLDGWLEHAVPYFSDDTVVGVGGPALTPSTDSFLSAAGGRVYANIFVSGGYRRRYIPTRVCNDDDLPSCNLFVRKAAVESVGGYDVRYWPGEDTQLCMALTENTGKRIVYDPWVQVTHHRRSLFLPHLRQVSRYARHRGHFARRGFSTSFRLCYMVPTAFVIGVLLGGIVVTIANASWLTWLYMICCGAYLFLTLISSFSLNLFMWIVTWLGVVATHFAYGINFAYGWFAPRMETKVKSFDHFGDKAPSSNSSNNDRNKD